MPPRTRPQIAPLGGAVNRVTLKDENIHEPAFSRIYVAPNYSEKTKKSALALEVFDEIFGTGTTSRLYKALVLKMKVATSVSSSYDDTAVDPIAYEVTAQPAPDKDLAEVEKGVDNVIQDLLKNGVTDAELADAKTRLQAQAILARDSLVGPAHSIGEAVATGQSIDDIESWPDNIAAVTKDEVNTALRSVLGNDAPGGVTGVTGWLLPANGNSRAPKDAAAAANTVPVSSGPIR